MVLTLGKISYHALFNAVGALEVGSDLYNVRYNYTTECHHGSIIHVLYSLEITHPLFAGLV